MTFFYLFLPISWSEAFSSNIFLGPKVRDVGRRRLQQLFPYYGGLAGNLSPTPFGCSMSNYSMAKDVKYIEIYTRLLRYILSEFWLVVGREQTVDYEKCIACIEMSGETKQHKKRSTNSLNPLGTFILWNEDRVLPCVRVSGVDTVDRSSPGMV